MNNFKFSEKIPPVNIEVLVHLKNIESPDIVTHFLLLYLEKVIYLISPFKDFNWTYMSDSRHPKNYPCQVRLHLVEQLSRR